MVGCPIVNPQTCCQVVVEFKTQLVPPALANSVTTRVFFSQQPVIEDVCPEKVIICGKLTKEITYTTVDANGEQNPNTLTDERPFQCFIDHDDANEGDDFEVVGFAVLCEGTPRLQNSASRPGPGGIGSIRDNFFKHENLLRLKSRGFLCAPSIFRNFECVCGEIGRNQLRR